MNTAMILGLVRHGLTLLGGYLAAKGHLDPANVDVVVGAVLTIVGAGWSVQSKKA
jgi:flagellar motor component MotA